MMKKKFFQVFAAALTLHSVDSVMLVLAKTDNSFIGCAEKQESLTTEGDGTKVTAVQSISKSVLGAYYGTEGKLDDTQIRVFEF